MIRSRLRSGFTFIEMMVVIFIISLMSALVVANMDGITARGEVSRGAHDLGNKILFLRDLAVQQARSLSLEIDVENSRWREIDRPTPNEVPDPDDREDLTFYGTWWELPPGIFIDEISVGREWELDDRFEITISEMGELFPSGFVAYIRHEDMDEDQGVSVEVSGLMGSVQYHRGRIEAEEVREEHDF